MFFWALRCLRSGTSVLILRLPILAGTLVPDVDDSTANAPVVDVAGVMRFTNCRSTNDHILEVIK